MSLLRFISGSPAKHLPEHAVPSRSTISDPRSTEGLPKVQTAIVPSTSATLKQKSRRRKQWTRPFISSAYRRLSPVHQQPPGLTVSAAASLAPRSPYFLASQAPDSSPLLHPHNFDTAFSPALSTTSISSPSNSKISLPPTPPNASPLFGQRRAQVRFADIDVIERSPRSQSKYTPVTTNPLHLHLPSHSRLFFRSGYSALRLSGDSQDSRVSESLDLGRYQFPQPPHQDTKVSKRAHMYALACMHSKKDLTRMLGSRSIKQDQACHSRKLARSQDV